MYILVLSVFHLLIKQIVQKLI